MDKRMKCGLRNKVVQNQDQYLALFGCGIRLVKVNMESLETKFGGRFYMSIGCK